MKSLTVPISRFWLLIVLIQLLLFVPAGAISESTEIAAQGTPVSMQDGPSDPAEVEAFLDYTVPANLAKFNVPGATVAVVKDGELVLAKGYGYSDLSNKTAVDGNTSRFRIGSITKLFTWTAVMQLVAEGKIDLDADVNTYLKDFQMPDTYPGQPITMRHLMTHTAGFEDAYKHMTVQETGDLIPFSEYCAQNIPARVWPPGTVSSYSNYGTTLAAVIVEEVSGIPYEEYLQTRILSPLGMEQTSIKEDLPPALAHNLSQGYVYGNSENDPAPDDIYVISPAGSISSTAPDMSRFLAAHMLDGTFQGVTILPADTAQLMHARAFANDPRVSGMCLGFYEQHLNDRRLIEHGGDTKLFHSLLVIIPEEQAGFFISYNSAGGNKARDEFLVEFMDHYYPVQKPEVPVPDPSAASRLQLYAGTYESNRHNFASFDKYLSGSEQMEIIATPDGTLILPHGTKTIELVETSPGTFTRLDGTRPASGDIVFHTRNDGSVDFFSMANLPIFVFDRVPWYATTGFTDTIRTAVSLIIASVLLWPLLAAFRRVYGISDPEVPHMAHVARWTAGSAAVLLLLFVFILLPDVVSDTALMESYMAGQAIPTVITVLTMLPIIAAGLTLLAIASVVLAWRDRYWTVMHRAHYTLITSGLVAMLWWVDFNNLWVFCL